MSQWSLRTAQPELIYHGETIVCEACELCRPLLRSAVWVVCESRENNCFWVQYN